MKLGAYIDGIGILGPGISDWPHAEELLSGRQPYQPGATVLPVPSMLPPAERRRTGRVVKLALAIASQAVSSAGVDPVQLASVFAASGGDGHICHEICEALAQPAREVSPTRFSNSVHNVAAGYWSIATGSMAESNALCAFDASFGAGLLEVLTQIAVERRPVLLAAYDSEYPQPLHAKRPIPDAFGVALILAPQKGVRSIARIETALTEEAADKMMDPQFETLRRAIPAARSLPLLRLLAMQSPGRAILDYLDVARLAVRFEPCR
jgi:Beta-ketoacyl synthase, N-terminal domain